MNPLLTNNTFFCPLCKSNHSISPYLQSVFNGNEKMIWLSNMITHYRHNHITSWNKCWEYNGHRYRGNWFRNYNEEKAKVNERAKRQIIRKALNYLKFHAIDKNCFMQLKNNDNNTIHLITKKLNY